MFSAGRAYRVFFPVKRSKLFYLYFFDVESSGIYTSRYYNSVSGSEFPYKQPEVLCGFEGCAVNFVFFLVLYGKNNVSSVNSFWSCRDCTFERVRVHIPYFCNTFCGNQVHISTLICSVYGKTFNRLSLDQACSFCNYGRMFSSDPEEYGICRVRYTDNKSIFKVYSVPGIRISLSVSLKKTSLFYFAWGSPFSLLPVCQVLESMIPFFEVKHSPACRKGSYQSSSIFEAL